MGEVPSRADGPSQEEITIHCVRKAAEAAFCPLSGNPSRTEAVKTLAALVAFLEAAEKQPPRTLRDWRVAIERLTIHLGAKP